MSYELKHYLNAINYEKKNSMDTDDEMWEKKYPPYVVNRCLAPFTDTIMLVNEMNKLHHLDKKLQFDFLLNSIRPRKRYTPWMKAKKVKDLEYVKEYYGYSNEKAKQALRLLSESELNYIKSKLDIGCLLYTSPSPRDS